MRVVDVGCYIRLGPLIIERADDHQVPAVMARKECQRLLDRDLNAQ